MNISKIILLILFSFSTTVNYAQNTSKLDCENGFQTIETDIESQKSASYKIIYSQKLYADDSFEFSEGFIVISDLNDSITIDETIKVIVTIGVENKLSKITAFKSCKAVDLYFKKFKLLPQDEEYLFDNLLPTVKIDLSRGLSKKQRKKNKRKRDLIEMVSKKSCEQLQKLNTNKINAQQLNEVVTRISIQYLKEAMKVYEMSFEESVDEFLTDLTNHLFYDCELMKEFASEFKE
jgi:hypothetical protein